MASRFGHQKPDPAIKKNVIRSRQGAKGAKRAQGFVVGASLAVTLMGWALFAHEDAQTALTLQSADSNSATPVASTQQVVSSSPTPIVANIQITATSVASALQASSTPTPVAAALVR